MVLSFCFVYLSHSSSTVLSGGAVNAALKSASFELLNVKPQYIEFEDHDSCGQLPTILAHSQQQNLRCGEYRVTGGDTARVMVPLLQPVNNTQLQERKPQEAPLPATQTAGGTAVVIGASGGIASVLIANLIDRGAAQIIAVSRSEPQQVTKYSQVNWIPGDSTQAQTWERVVAALQQSPSPIATVYHLAGKLEDGLLRGITHTALKNVLAPKMTTCEKMLEWLPQLRPQRVVLFSSLCAITGSPGQYAYAAANGYLDTWASWASRQFDIPIQSIAWGPWSEVGMVESLKASGTTDNTELLQPINPATALAALVQATACDDTHLLVAKLDNIIDNETIITRSRVAVGDCLFAHNDDVQSKANLADVIVASIRELAGVGDNDSGWQDKTFTELGIDSLGLTQLRKRIAGTADINLSIAEFCNHPSCNKLLVYLDPRDEVWQGSHTEVAPDSKQPQQDNTLRMKLIDELCSLVQQA